jgi:hypothetical protein
LSACWCPVSVVGAAPSTPLPPQNLDAEERLLGALLLAGLDGPAATASAVAAAQQHGLAPADFYRQGGNGSIYAAVLALAATGAPSSPVAVSAELRRRGELDAAGGEQRIVELFAYAHAWANAGHYAGLVRAAAQERALLEHLQQLQAQVQGGALDPAAARTALDDMQRLLLAGPHAPWAPVPWEAAQAMPVPAVPELVAGLVEAGTPGLLTGQPYTHKSWLALEIAHRVAAGGSVLGRYPVVRQGPVGFWWYDDAHERQLGRLQAYGRAQGCTGPLPVHLYLNDPAQPRLQLPGGVGALRAEVQRQGLVLAVLDSLYNFAPGLDFKEQQAGALLAQLKAEVCDPTGCALLIIHHATWAGGRGRAYGDVFQEAAVRWGIHLARDDGDRLHLATRANNMATTARLPLAWDAEALQLQPVADVAQGALDAQVLAHLQAHPGSSQNAVERAIGGKRERVRAALRRLEAAGRATNLRPGSAGAAGRTPGWYPADPSSHAATGRAPAAGAHPGAGGAQAPAAPHRARPPKGRGAGRGAPPAANPAPTAAVARADNTGEGPGA